MKIEKELKKVARGRFFGTRLLCPDAKKEAILSRHTTATEAPPDLSVFHIYQKIVSRAEEELAGLTYTLEMERLRGVVDRLQKEEEMVTLKDQEECWRELDRDLDGYYDRILSKVKEAGRVGTWVYRRVIQECVVGEERRSRVAMKTVFFLLRRGFNEGDEEDFRGYLRSWRGD